MEFTETGKTVYERTYARTKPDGSKETWPETVARVVDGNLSLVDPKYSSSEERDDLIRMITEFKIIPAGRHLWASGTPAPHLFNCWAESFSNQDITDHFQFTFMRLMEGGGVGANYSNKYLEQYATVKGYGYVDLGEMFLPGDAYKVHIVCDPEHADYDKLKDAGVLSEDYDHEWAGSFEVEDSREGWAAALTDFIRTYYRDAKNLNGVFVVSGVGGEGSRLKTFGGRASGPLPLAVMLHEVSEVLNNRLGEKLTGLDAMAIDHAIAKCVVSGGNRRSARMSIMHWSDPEIFEFTKAKAEGGHWTTNISVEVDDKFWRLVNTDDTGSEGAKHVLNAIVNGMLTNGEPGFWNSSLNNVGEPEWTPACNPCSEINLLSKEPCNLGHINLAGFVNPDGTWDLEGLGYAHALMTRFLIRATFAKVNDPESREVLNRNRRIGVGHLGVASAIAMAGWKFSEIPNGEGDFWKILVGCKAVVDDTAVGYAHHLRIPVPVKTTTVAPTGTIAKMPGVSEGIHPIFAKYFNRRIRFSDVDPDQRAQVEQYRDQGYHTEPCQSAPQTTVVTIPTKDILLDQVTAIHGPDKAAEVVQSAADVSLVDMMRFQAVYQAHYADNAVSFTVNVDPDEYTPEEVTEAIIAIGPQLKGLTLFPEKSFPQAPYERISRSEYEFNQYLMTVADGVDESCAQGACPVR